MTENEQNQVETVKQEQTPEVTEEVAETVQQEQTPEVTEEANEE